MTTTTPASSEKSSSLRELEGTELDGITGGAMAIEVSTGECQVCGSGTDPSVMSAGFDSVLADGQ